MHELLQASRGSTESALYIAAPLPEAGNSSEAVLRAEGSFPTTIRVLHSWPRQVRDLRRRCLLRAQCLLSRGRSESLVPAQVMGVARPVAPALEGE